MEEDPPPPPPPPPPPAASESPPAPSSPSPSPSPSLNTDHDAWHVAPDGSTRATTWPLLARDMRVPNHYAALLALAGETPETAQQIEKDLPRTGATFAVQGLLKPGLPMWDSLRNVLTAYAAHDPRTGYVQSMNFLAAFLLLAGVSEEDAFWSLCALVNVVVPGYFSEGMASAKLDQRVFSRLLHAHLPGVGLHLESLAPDNIVCGIISSQWLLTLFVNVLPTEATMRVWDEVFKAKNRAPLFASCLALLSPSADDVMACSEMGEAIELLQRLGSEVDVEGFVARVKTLLEGPLHPSKFDIEVARERGRRRRKSDDGLPQSVRDTPPLTETDEIVSGIVRRVLRTDPHMTASAW